MKFGIDRMHEFAQIVHWSKYIASAVDFASLAPMSMKNTLNAFEIPVVSDIVHAGMVFLSSEPLVAIP